VTRPAADVVVPFGGSAAGLEQLEQRLARIDVRPGDTVTVADNRSDAVDRDGVVAAKGRYSSYFARNRGAERRTNDWIVFIDADVDPAPDLLDRYFDEAPGDAVGVLAGGIRDASLSDAPTLAERYAVSAAQMSHANTLRAGPWSYAQTANAAVRRKAFEDVGGFEEGIRSGGDADLCFRLRVAGWRLEQRPAALVVHDNRARARDFLRQKARHGAGAAWLNKRYPGSFPPIDRREYGERLLRELKTCAGLVAKRQSREAYELVFPSLAIWAFELGRFFPNRAGSMR
jgi:GT2 family glycosyltransferase